MAKQYALATLAAEYRNLWASVEVVDRAGALKLAREVIASKSAYQRVERETGVPWFIVGALNMRESPAGARFTTWLHNGDPMRDKQGRPIRTTHVPENRPPDPAVDWFAGAYDALVTLKHYDQIKQWGPEHVAYAGEGYNGFGYRNPRINIPTPYLWGGTNHQQRGKYVKDGVFDRTVWDTQIGVMAILKVIMELDASARFADVPKPTHVPAPTPAPKTPAPSPKATDTKDVINKPMKSRTVWATIAGAVSGFVGTVSAAFQSINNPYALAAFAVVLVVIIAAAVIVWRNYGDVVKLVHHLAPDDADDGDGVQIVGEG